jgi:UDP-N-acetylmuramoyl-tripeptide--D-alanyl-D-alanine ligase
MGRLTLADVVAATAGSLRGGADVSAPIASVQADPGLLSPGDLFVAVPGPPIDGHELIPLAALRGATAAVVSEAWSQRARKLALPLVVVDDPVAALQRLAAAHRRRLGLAVVGVTGSVGKTSTKELVASVLGQRFRTYRNPGNRNNELGVPLSLLELDEETEVAVLELGGAYAPGELRLLAEIARPGIAVVTNVHPVHLERMGSIKAIAETKAEVVEALAPDGLAVLNGDDPLVCGMRDRCRGRVVTYGHGAVNDVRAEAAVLRGLEGCSFDLVLDGERHSARTPLLGPHAVELALAAIAVGHAVGVPVVEILAALRDTGAQVRLRPRPGVRGSLLLDDSYNSSPTSAISALTLLDQCRAGRRIAVLGDMLELGSIAEQEHRAVGRRAARTVDILVTYGEQATAISESARELSAVPAARPVVVHFEATHRAEAIAYLQDLVGPGDTVLVKGSRSLRMEEIIDALSAADEPAGKAD